MRCVAKGSLGAGGACFGSSTACRDLWPLAFAVHTRKIESAALALGFVTYARSLRLSLGNAGLDCLLSSRRDGSRVLLAGSPDPRVPFRLALAPILESRSGLGYPRLKSDQRERHSEA